MLYIFGGLPGAGKSTLSQALARQLHAAHLRVDTIEHALRDTGTPVTGPEGYVIAYRVAEDNLRLGLSVVADTVNPLQVTRQAWRAVATQLAVPFAEIEVICSDRTEHRARIETRDVGIAGFPLPTWEDVVAREYEPWETDRIVIDTAGQTPAESLAALQQALAVFASPQT